MSDGRERDEGPAEPPAGKNPVANGDAEESGGPVEVNPPPAGGAPGLFARFRTIEVAGERLPVASLLRRGAALAVDLCFALLGVSLLVNALSFAVPLDTERATGPLLGIFFVLGAYILWVRDRGASRPGGTLRHGLSVGRWFLGLRLVPVAGPRRFTRPVTVAERSSPEGETMRIIRAVLLGVAATLVALFLLGLATSRTMVFTAVVDYAQQAAPFAAERGGDPELASIPSALLVSRSRAYVRVDTEWRDASDPLEFFLAREAGEWRVVEVRIGKPELIPDYALYAPDSRVPAP